MSRKFFNHPSAISVRRVALRSKKATKFQAEDRVRVLVPVAGDDSPNIPAGSIGTIVRRWAHGIAFEVEFTGSIIALVTVEPRFLELVERLAG